MGANAQRYQQAMYDPSTRDQERGERTIHVNAKAMTANAVMNEWNRQLEGDGEGQDLLKRLDSATGNQGKNLLRQLPVGLLDDSAALNKWIETDPHGAGVKKMLSGMSAQDRGDLISNVSGVWGGIVNRENAATEGHGKDSARLAKEAWSIANGPASEIEEQGEEARRRDRFQNAYIQQLAGESLTGVEGKAAIPEIAKIINASKDDKGNVDVNKAMAKIPEGLRKVLKTDQLQKLFEDVQADEKTGGSADRGAELYKKYVDQGMSHEDAEEAAAKEMGEKGKVANLMNRQGAPIPVDDPAKASPENPAAPGGADLGPLLAVVTTFLKTVSESGTELKTILEERVGKPLTEIASNTKNVAMPLIAMAPTKNLAAYG
jgi:hypothetical protein